MRKLALLGAGAAILAVVLARGAVRTGSSGHQTAEETGGGSPAASSEEAATGPDEPNQKVSSSKPDAPSSGARSPHSVEEAESTAIPQGAETALAHFKKRAVSFLNQGMELRRNAALGLFGGPCTPEWVEKNLAVGDPDLAARIAEEVRIRNASVDQDLEALADQYVSAFDSAFHALVEGERVLPFAPGEYTLERQLEASQSGIETYVINLDDWTFELVFKADEFPALAQIKQLQATLLAEQRRNYIEVLDLFRASAPDTRRWPHH